MKRGYGVVLAFVAACMVATGPCIHAKGAESSVIEKASVSLKTTYGESGDIPEPEITVDVKGGSLEDIQYRTDHDRWEPGKKVRIEITVQADEGKYFPVSLNRSQCKVSGGEFVSARSLDDKRLQIKVDYKPVTVLGETERAGWFRNSKKRATWKSVKYAPGYSLVLYGDDKVVKRMNVETNSADLSDFMKDMDKTYYYEVKAVPVTSEEKKYLKEGQFVTSTSQEFDWEDLEEEEEKKQTPGDGGEIRGDSYIMPDGSRAKDTWKKISGKWYFFDSNGIRVKGWFATGGRWYYMDQSGVMCTGWISPDGHSWYFLDENGEMQTGWVEPTPGSWYYLREDGLMQKGWVQPTVGSWYYLREDGLMQKGWLQIGEHWYYFRDNGTMAVNTVVDGWQIDADGIAYRIS